MGSCLSLRVRTSCSPNSHYFWRLSLRKPLSVSGGSFASYVDNYKSKMHPSSFVGKDTIEGAR